jgi:phenylalanyl-tRNA synthetase beta chain
LPPSTVVGEVVLEVLWAHLDRGGRRLASARRLVRHPPVSVDVAVVVDEDVPYATVRDSVRAGAGELLEELRLFDEYRGAQVGDGKKSLGFHLRLQSAERQLTDEDADAAIDGVASAIGELGGSLRR